MNNECLAIGVFDADRYPAVIASKASNPSLKRKSPKQTRTNSVFAKIRKDEFD